LGQEGDGSNRAGEKCEGSFEAEGTGSVSQKKKKRKKENKRAAYQLIDRLGATNEGGKD
jgi:hypothetical protein